MGIQIIIASYICVVIFLDNYKLHVHCFIFQSNIMRLNECLIKPLAIVTFRLKTDVGLGKVKLSRLDI